MTRRSTIGSAHGTLSLRRATVLRRFQMFNARKHRFAIGTFGSTRLFVNALCFEHATGCTHATPTALLGIPEALFAWHVPAGAVSYTTARDGTVDAIAWTASDPN